MMKWIKTTFPGVRYREHETRKHGIRRDQYFTIRYKLNGKDKEEGIGWATEDWTAAKAYDRLKELKENRKKGEGPQTLAEKREIENERRGREQAKQVREEKEAITFNDFFNDTYLPQSKTDKKSRTAQREEGFFNNWFKPILAPLPLKDISSFHLEKLKKAMADGGQSPRSIEYALAIIRQAFNMAKRLGVYGGESPTSQVKVPKVDNGRMRFLTRPQATALLATLKKKSADVHDMTLLSLHAGLRFGEIASLTWQDVDLNKGVLTIRDAKAGSRYAFLTDQAMEMFRNRPQGKPSEYIFQKRKEKNPDKVSQKRIGRKLDKISHTFFRVVDDLKLNDGVDDPRLKICFHSCRHSYASWMIEQGADLYTVQKLLGHKTNIMTQRYAHLSENRLKDAAKALGQAWQAHEVSKEGQDKVPDQAVESSA